jgi:hypothetical protein
MEGSRLTLKRHVPRGRQKLAVLIGLGGVVALIALVLQMKMTLSASALSAASQDAANMKADFNSTVSDAAEQVTPSADEARAADIAAFKNLLEAALKASDTAEAPADGQPTAETSPNTPVTAETTPSTTPTTPPTP